VLEKISSALGGLPIPAVVALLALLATQLSLQLYCLYDLSRRLSVPGGKKWRWVLLIVVGNLVGAILYLALGRSAPLAVSDRSPSRSADDRQRALDRIYSDKKP